MVDLRCRQYDPLRSLKQERVVCIDILQSFISYNDIVYVRGTLL